MAFSQNDFEDRMKGLIELEPGSHVAAAVSGGPDSMSLLYMLSRWAAPRDIRVDAYTVDHGLRPESAEEARKVGLVAAELPNVTHKTLFWSDDKPQSRVLEEARAARYKLLQSAMKQSGTEHLFVAHHQDDQAETFLIRLSKGSGLDGLSGMKVLQPMDAGGVIVRPLLDVSKSDLVAMCDTNNIAYVLDPTNENQNYTRPRLRAAQEILEEEGLSSKRLAVTAKRLGRARAALDQMAKNLYDLSLKEKRSDGFLFDYRALTQSHEELVLRVLLNAMEELRPDADYAPRMEKAEALLERLLRDPAFNGATLGGCIFAMDRKNGTLWIGKE